MPIEVKNADVIITLVKERLGRAVERLEGAMQDEVTRMVQRTISGVDVNGQKFAPYTPGYNRRKASLRSGFTTRTGKKGKNAGPGFDMPIQNFDLPNGLCLSPDERVDAPPAVDPERNAGPFERLVSRF